LKTSLGKVVDTFTITPLHSEVLVLDREWPCEAVVDDTLEIVTESGVTYEVKVQDKITFQPRTTESAGKTFPSLRVNTCAGWDRDHVPGAEVFLKR
jgi:hypothetical protein